MKCFIFFLFVVGTGGAGGSKSRGGGAKKNKKWCKKQANEKSKNVKEKEDAFW